MQAGSGPDLTCRLTAECWAARPACDPCVPFFVHPSPPGRHRQPLLGIQVPKQLPYLSIRDHRKPPVGEELRVWTSLQKPGILIVAPPPATLLLTHPPAAAGSSNCRWPGKVIVARQQGSWATSHGQYLGKMAGDGKRSSTLPSLRYSSRGTCTWGQLAGRTRTTRPGRRPSMMRSVSKRI